MRAKRTFDEERQIDSIRVQLVNPPSSKVCFFTLASRTTIFSLETRVAFT